MASNLETAMKQSPTITFSADAIPALSGLDPSVTPMEALRRELESPANRAYRKELMTIARVSLPDISAVEKRIEKKLLETEEVKAFATSIRFSPDADRRCREIAEEIACETPLHSNEDAFYVCSRYRLSDEGKDRSPDREKDSPVAIDEEMIRRSVTKRAKRVHKEQRERVLKAKAIAKYQKLGNAAKAVPLSEPPAKRRLVSGSQFVDSEPCGSYCGSGAEYEISARADAWEFDRDWRGILSVKIRDRRFGQPDYELVRFLGCLVANGCLEGRILQFLDGSIISSSVISSVTLADRWVPVKSTLDRLAEDLARALSSTQSARQLLFGMYLTMHFTSLPAAVEREEEEKPKPKGYPPMLRMYRVKDDAIFPTREGSYYVLYAREDVRSATEVDTGIAIDIPPGIKALVHGCGLSARLNSLGPGYGIPIIAKSGSNYGVSAYRGGKCGTMKFEFDPAPPLVEDKPKKV